MRRLTATDWLVGVCLFLGVSLGAVAVHRDDLRAGQRAIIFDESMGLKQLAAENGVPVKELLHALSHDDRSAWDWPRRAPVRSLPVSTEAVREALEHTAAEHNPVRDVLKFCLWGVYLAACLLILVRAKKTARLRLFFLIGAVGVFGIALGSTPNPMEAIVKAFKATRGMEANPYRKAVLLGLFSLMAIVGSKLICGWGCQLGTLQDLIHRVSPFRKAKRRKVPFWLANTTRIALFVVFLDLLYGWVAGVESFVIYHQLNFFKLYGGGLAPVALYLLPVLLALSFFVYRPFCQFVCPFGLFSWILESVSLYRIRVTVPLCTDCGACVSACPTEAMAARLHGNRKVLLPDCWACGACVEACPTKAVAFDFRTPTDRDQAPSEDG